MANYFWVGGSGTWDSTDGFHWSTATGKAITASCTGSGVLTVTAGTVVLGDSVWSANDTFLGVTTSSLGGGQWTMSLSTGTSFASQGMIAAATGTTGVGFPTPSDNVTFDANSGKANFVVAVDVNAFCANLTQSISTAGRITFASINPVTPNVIGCSGTPTFNAATVIDSTYPVSLWLNASSGAITAGLNNVRFYTVSVGDIAGGTASYTFGSGVTCQFLHLYNGTLNTNGQTITITTQYYYSYNQSCGFLTQNSYSKTLTLGASVINIGTSASESQFSDAIFDMESGGGTVTLTAGTSTITVGSTSTSVSNDSLFYGGALTYRNVVLNGAFSDITSPNTFYAFTKNSLFNDSYLKVWAGQTIQNSFILAGGVATRLLVFSDESRNQRTFTLTGTATRTLSYVSFMDISLSYSASVTGTSLGDFGNNSGITFAAAVTRYLVLGGVNKNFSSTTAWSATSGGATGATAPLPQDTVIMNAASGSGDLSLDSIYFGTALNTTGFTGNVIPGGTNLIDPSFYVFGQPTDPVGVISGIGYPVVFRSNSNVNLPSALPSTVVIDAGSATATMSSSDSIVGGVYVLSGNFSTNSYDLSALSLKSGAYSLVNVNQNRTLSSLSTYTFGSSVISLSSSIPIGFSGVDTVNAGTSTIQLTSTNATVTFSTNGKTLYNLKLTPGSAAIRYAIGTGTFNNITLDPNTDLIRIDLTTGTTITVGSMNINGSKGAGVIIGSNLTTTSNALFYATLAIGSDISTDYVAYIGITKSGASSLFARGAADLGGNVGISFQQHSVIAFSGSGATSFTVPGNFTGSSYLLVIGAGGGAGCRSSGSLAASGGGGGGAISVSTNLNISAGQTIYLNSPIGGAGATSGGFAGISPVSAWVNISANATPTLSSNGAVADSGNGSSGSSASGGSGGSIASSLGQLEYAGASGSSGSVGGGGGGSSGSLLARLGRGSLLAQYGGAGGGSYENSGTNGSSTVNGGTGGAVGVNPGGTNGAGGNPPVAGGNGSAGTSVGGGGGGGSTINGVNSAAGGNGASGSQWTYNSLNGVAGSGSIGYGGGGGGGGGFATGVTSNSSGGSGGAGSVGSGGGGGGRATSTRNAGSGGNGGNSLILFVYIENRGGGFATIIG